MRNGTLHLSPPSTSAAVSKREMSKLDPPQTPDDARGLEVGTRTR
jgi:hypothetical protein